MADKYLYSVWSCYKSSCSKHARIAGSSSPRRLSELSLLIDFPFDIQHWVVWPHSGSMAPSTVHLAGRVTPAFQRSFIKQCIQRILKTNIYQNVKARFTDVNYWGFSYCYMYILLDAIFTGDYDMATGSAVGSKTVVKSCVCFLNAHLVLLCTGLLHCITSAMTVRISGISQRWMYVSCTETDTSHWQSLILSDCSKDALDFDVCDFIIISYWDQLAVW